MNSNNKYEGFAQCWFLFSAIVGGSAVIGANLETYWGDRSSSLGNLLLGTIIILLTMGYITLLLVRRYQILRAHLIISGILGVTVGVYNRSFIVGLEGFLWAYDRVPVLAGMALLVYLYFMASTYFIMKKIYTGGTDSSSPSSDS